MAEDKVAGYSNGSANESSSNSMVAVCGATGYIGTHLLAQLKHKGISARCLVRPESGAVNLFDECGLDECGAKVVYADLSGSKPLKPSLIESLSGSKVLVNLVGSIAPRHGESLDNLHRHYTAKLINLCNTCGIPKMVMVTALGTQQNADSKYHASKWKAEQELVRSGLSYVILRPSLVYGRQTGSKDSKLVRRYMDLINDRPLVPLIGGGHNRLQPIFIGDLVQCIEKSLEPSPQDNSVWELGGPEVIELRQFVEMLMRQLGQMKRFADMPVVAARSIAAVCELTQEVPTLSQDQVTLTLSDNICERNALQEIFHIEPTSIADGMLSYAAQSAVPVSV